MTPSVRSLSVPSVRVARTAGREKALVCMAGKNSKTTTSVVEVAPTPLQVRSRFARSPEPSRVRDRNERGIQSRPILRAHSVRIGRVSTSHVRDSPSPVHPRGTHRLRYHWYLKLEARPCECEEPSRRVPCDKARAWRRDGSRLMERMRVDFAGDYQRPRSHSRRGWRDCSVRGTRRASLALRLTFVCLRHVWAGECCRYRCLTRRCYSAGGEAAEEHVGRARRGARG